MEDMIYAFDFGMRLKELREVKKLTLELASELTGISKNTLYRYENNLQEPTKTNLIALARGYNTSLDYIAGLSHVPVFKLYDLTPKQQEVIRGFVKYFIDDLNKGEKKK